MNYEPVVDRSARLEMRHVFVYNFSPEINDFETDIIMVINIGDIDTLIGKHFKGDCKGFKLYSCRLSAEEAEELNLQLKYQPHRVFDKLLDKKATIIYPKANYF